MDKFGTKIDLVEYVSQWPLFYGPVIFFIAFKLFDGGMSYLCDTQWLA